jgi:hypothetical protein
MTTPIFLWGVGMCLLGLINVAIFGTPGAQAPALLFGIGGFMVLLAVVLFLTGYGRNVATPLTSSPDVSPPTVFLAAGIVLMALAPAFGLWLVWIGGGVAIVGIAGVVREWIAQRRARRRVTLGGDGG